MFCFLNPRIPSFTGALGLGIGLLTLGTLPAQALQVQVTPAQPALGDTLRVEVRDALAPPSVLFRGRTYPAFEVETGRWRALLPTSPLDRAGPLQIQAVDGQQAQTVVLGLRQRRFPVQRIWLSGRGGSLEPTQLELDRVAQFRATLTPQRFWIGPFRRPNGGPLSTGYGVQRYYNGVFAQDYYHRGVDYASGVGSPVVAPAAGRVILVGLERQGFRLHGNCVGLDHGQGVLSIFLHLSQVSVSEGQMVQVGQRLGAVGSTGAATGPHLHWGLYVNGIAVDPAPWQVGIE